MLDTAGGGKSSPKMEKYNSYFRRSLNNNNNNTKLLAASSKLLFRTTLLIALILVLCFSINLISPSTTSNNSPYNSFLHYTSSAAWESHLIKSATPLSPTGKTILVTGAAGFIGSHASLALRKRGDGVLGLDNFNSYYDPSLKRSRQSLLLSHGILILEADLNDTPLLTRLFTLIPFTHVLHLAAQAGVRYAQQNPQSYVASNVAGFISLLESAKSAPHLQPSIIWASSSSVYGLNTAVPFSELHRTDRPASLYAATKKAGEEIAHTYNHIYGLSLTALRFFTVYGPYGRPDMAYFFFTDKILRGDPIEIYKTRDGKEVARDFTYIDDVVKGCLGAIDSAKRSTGGGGGGKKAELRVYNLGNTSPVGVGRLVGILEELLGVRARKRVVTMPRNGDVPFTHANVTAAARDFGYRPETDLETGLRRFVDWYVGYYGVQDRVKTGKGIKKSST